MVISLLIACLLVILGSVALGARAIRTQQCWIEDRIDAEKAELEAQVRAFVTAPDPETPSPFAQLVVASLAGVTPDLANAVAMSLKASLMGQASGIARGAKAVEMGLQAEAMSDNPMAQVAAALFEKQIKKNPMLGLGLQQVLANRSTKGLAAAGSSNGNNRFHF